MGNIVCDGTEFSCPMCSGKLKISVSSSSTKGDSKNLANTANSSFPPPGGKCSITQAPCNPSVVNVDPGQSPVKIDAQPALGDGCKFQCAVGGLITVSSPGQTVAQHNGAKPAEKAKKQKKISRKDPRIKGVRYDENGQPYVEPEDFKDDPKEEKHFDHGFDSKIAPYDALKKEKQGAGSAYQAHHIVEQRHIKNWDLDEELTKKLIKKMPSQIITKEQHKAVSEVLRQLLPHGKMHDLPVVERAYAQAYQKIPAYEQAVKEFFKELRSGLQSPNITNMASASKS